MCVKLQRDRSMRGTNNKADGLDYYELELLYLINRANIPLKMTFTRLKDPYHHDDQYLIEPALAENAMRFHLGHATLGAYASCWENKFANASEALKIMRTMCQALKS